MCRWGPRARRAGIGGARPYDSSAELRTQALARILRRVVEGYVASGQPVGSRALVGQSGLDVSSSTVRSELFELEAIGLLTHPHVGWPGPGAERVPRLRGGAGRRDRGRPGPFPLDLTAMRNELEEALRLTTEALSDDPSAGARVGAVAGGRRRTPWRCCGSVAGRDRRRDHGVGRRVEARIRVRHPVDPGVVDWARAYLAETIVGKRASASTVRRAFEARRCR